MNNTFLLFVFCLFTCFAAQAQTTDRIVPERCGTMQRLEEKLSRDPALRVRFEAEKAQFNKLVKERASSSIANRTEATVYTIPIVFHVVLTNQALVTNAQILAQLDTLNRDYAGTNGDSVRIPAFFKSVFGKSGIRFCLAQRTPDGEATTGIERTTTTKTSFSNLDDGVKHAANGGAASWDPSKYFNVWICPLSSSLLGYSTFPQDGSEADQGVAIDYRSLPGGAYTVYNGGKSLTHETGHYFNLYHIWGDDDGACNGTDFIDDTPNQSDATSGTLTGIKTDNCTTSGNGIMYENYMDYTDDVCLVLFTAQQVTRMESALSLYRSSLLSSDGCQPVVQRNYDARLVSISQPVQRLCTPSFTPIITIRNRGIQTLTSVVITVKVDGVTVATSTWTGSLATSTSATVSLAVVNATTGNHSLTISLSNPNNNTDEEPGNDALNTVFQYYPPVTAVSESFENTAFPPQAWDVVNPDGGITWQRVTGVAKTGTASAMINNFDNSAVGQKDDLRLPNISIASTIDTAFLSFQIAAAAYTATTTANNVWDTLEVLVSTNCGATYTSIYKKWGSSLVTRTTATTTAFAPLATEWRKDSVNLAAYIGNTNLLIAFRNTNGYENNVYLDDVNLRTVTVNPNLKAAGFLVTPSPTSGNIAVQFYPQPTNLTAVQIFNANGQKLEEINTTSKANNYYAFDLSRYAAGTYIVRAIFTDRVVVKKIMKY